MTVGVGGSSTEFILVSTQYSGLNSGISFLDEVFRLLFYQTTLSYSGLNSVILVSI
jgi:hypothetical protein